jgi:hypothetical protein
MKTQIILDNEFASLCYHSDTNIIHHTIKQYLMGEHLRTLMDTGFETLKKHNSTKWLSDDRNNGPLTPEDEEWARSVWFPKTIKAGWKHWAIVKPAKVLGQLNMRRYKETYAAAGIQADLFSELDDAMKWLIAQ